MVTAILIGHRQVGNGGAAVKAGNHASQKGGGGGGGGGGALGDGTHEGSPRNAKEYAEQSGVSRQEAIQLVGAVTRFTGYSYKEIRASQLAGKPNADAQKIEQYLKTVKPYKGEVFRGMSFKSEAEVDSYFGSSTITSTAMGSWTSDPVRANYYARSGGAEVAADRPVGVVLRVQNKSGASIQNVSQIKAENEVLVGSGAQYRVAGRTRNASGNIEISLVEL